MLPRDGDVSPEPGNHCQQSFRLFQGGRTIYLMKCDVIVAVLKADLTPPCAPAGSDGDDISSNVEQQLRKCQQLVPESTGDVHSAIHIQVHVAVVLMMSLSMTCMAQNASFSHRQLPSSRCACLQLTHHRAYHHISMLRGQAYLVVSFFGKNKTTPILWCE